MALDQAALLEVLEALQVTEVGDRLRQATETQYQALIEAEVTGVLGAGPHERPSSALGSATGTGPTPCPPRPATWSWGSAKLRAGSFFPSVLEGAAASTGRRSRW